MSASDAPHTGADRNLLFGILALHLNFVTRDALTQAIHAWVLDKAKPPPGVWFNSDGIRLARSPARCNTTVLHLALFSRQSVVQQWASANACQALRQDAGSL
jgi:hypothetical protein